MPYRKNTIFSGHTTTEQTLTRLPIESSQSLDVVFLH
jgi:hypothetical protein